MSKIPEELKYTKEHEWIKLEGSDAIVGITDHAQSELGDIVFVEMPEIGRSIKQGEEFGVVESVKTVSSLYAPISGTISAVNALLDDKPETINTDPYQEGWIIKLESIEKSESKNLLSASEYKKQIEA